MTRRHTSNVTVYNHRNRIMLGFNSLEGSILIQLSQSGAERLYKDLGIVIFDTTNKSSQSARLELPNTAKDVKK